MISNSVKEKLILLILPILSFVLCYTVSRYSYDGFHWGLNAYIAENIIGKRKIYEDFFVHYSILPNLIQSIFYFFSKNNVLSLILSTSLFYSIGNYFISITILKKTNLDFALLGSVILFLLHLFPNQPWHNYYFFGFLSIGIYLIFSQSKHSLFISGFFFALALLCYENFIHIFFLIFIVCVLFDYYFFNNKIIFEKKKIYKFFSSFFLTLAPFYIIIFFFGYKNGWLEVFNLNKFFFKFYELNYLTLIFSFFSNFIRKISNPLDSFSYIVYAILFIFNIFYILKCLIQKNNKYLYLVILSSVLIVFSMHKVNVFRFSTGFSISIIFFIFYFSKINNFRNILLVIILFLFGNILSYKNEANSFIPNSYHVSETKNYKEIKYFRSQFWSKEVWLHLTTINNLEKKIYSNCKFQEFYFVNYTLDAYYYLFFNKYKFFQYMPWYSDTKLMNELMHKFKIDFKKKLDEKINQKKVIIIIDKQNFNKINKNLNYNFKIITLPYSYYNKEKLFIIPVECYNKIKS